MSKNQKRIIFILPLFMIGGFLLFRLADYSAYLAFVREDGIAEYLQAFFYLFAASVMLWTAISTVKQVPVMITCLNLILFVLILFVAMEEISWGQRIFGVETPPGMVDLNAQKEINIHNIKPVYRWFQFSYIMVGLVYSLTWLMFRLKVVQRFSKRSSLVRVVHLFVPPWFLSLYPLGVITIFSFYLFIAQPAVEIMNWESFRIGVLIGWPDQEAAEFIFSLGFISYALSLRQIQIHRQNDFFTHKSLE